MKNEFSLFCHIAEFVVDGIVLAGESLAGDAIGNYAIPKIVKRCYLVLFQRPSLWLLLALLAGGFYCVQANTLNKRLMPYGKNGCCSN